jgi:hypothetical protein
MVMMPSPACEMPRFGRRAGLTAGGAGGSPCRAGSRGRSMRSHLPMVDEISLTDLMMRALDNYMAQRRNAPDFQAKAQKALEDAEAQMARTRAMLLGTLSEGKQAEVSSPARTGPAEGRAF